MKNLKKMNEQETREMNGGAPYCKVCGYSNRSEWNVMGHIAATHPSVVLRTFWSLLTSQTDAIASLMKK